MLIIGKKSRHKHRNKMKNHKYNTASKI